MFKQRILLKYYSVLSIELTEVTININKSVKFMDQLSRETFLVEAEKIQRDQELIDIGIKYLENLQKFNLPPIFSTKHLSILIGIEYLELRTLIDNRDKCYRNVYLKKKKGGFRLISAPKQQLKTYRSG